MLPSTPQKKVKTKYDSLKKLKSVTQLSQAKTNRFKL
jgi:hypothetical protein